MKITTVKGMNDYLPQEAELRDYLQSKILEIYKRQGFNRIYTPIVEDIENLEKSEGGENLNLIFKILKRGDKLTKAIEQGAYNELADTGLRYDLTLPLSRFYACHKNDLILPFKVIQIDRVYRAERPQKGRDREFVQCDIDILGSNSINSEIELIDTTSRALLSIGIENFTIKINDRQLLRKMLTSFGFRDEDIDSVCITFDKLDKIGKSGVENELISKGFEEDVIRVFCEKLDAMPKTLQEFENQFGKTLESENLQKIIDSVSSLSKGKYDIKFDLTLVRGQGYYTGTVFEIESTDFSCSIGGGGRYDNLIGKFTGEKIPAVGFSIGFERIFSILVNKNMKSNSKKVAIIYDNDNFIEALQFSHDIQDKYFTCLFERPKKLGKLLNRLEELKYFGFVVFSEGTTIKQLNNN